MTPAFRWTVTLITLAILALGAALEAKAGTIAEYIARERLREALEELKVETEELKKRNQTFKNRLDEMAENTVRVTKTPPKPRPRPVQAKCYTASDFEAELRKQAPPGVEFTVISYTAAQTKRFKAILLEEIGSIHPGIKSANTLFVIKAAGTVFQLFMTDGCGTFAVRVPATKFDPLINKISVKAI